VNVVILCVCVVLLCVRAVLTVLMFNLDDALLAGHLGTGFSWFPCV
jgi:hypothetical protein